MDKGFLLVYLGVGVAAIAAVLWSGRASASESVSGDPVTPKPPVQPSLPLVSTGTPRGIRNNNPTNLRELGIAWKGKTGSDGVYTTFATPADGLRAGFVNLQTYMQSRGLLTVRGIVARWAPSSENNTQAYALDVAQRVGVGLDQTLAYATHARALIPAIVYHENGQNPYTRAQYQQAYEDSFS